MRQLSLSKITFILFALGFAATASYAQTLSTLANFDGTNGNDAVASLVQGTDGNFYSVTLRGGTNNDGTVFQLTPQGQLTNLHSFDSSADGYGPQGLVEGADGDFYGTTEAGGPNANGTIFKITTAGSLTTVYNFCIQTYASGSCTDGSSPYAGLTLGSDGNFYGTTYYGGANSTTTCPAGCGTVFKMTPSGTLTTLYNFCAQSNCADGAEPNSVLVQASDGNFYGTTAGAYYNLGTIFQIGASGDFANVFTFCGSGCTTNSAPNGVDPDGLVVGSDGNIYGTTFGGGTDGYGTVFKIIPSGSLTTIANFAPTAGSNGAGNPGGQIVQAQDGNFYGTAGAGTANCNNGCGTIFKMSPAAALTTLYSFCLTSPCSNGSTPTGLMQASNGLFYGTTTAGGANGDGTVFSLSAGTYALSVNPTSMTITAGQSGQATFTVTPQNGFDSQVTLSCSGLPAEATCSFNPTSVTPNGSSAATSTLTITTTAASAAAARRAALYSVRPFYALLLLPGMMVVLGGISRKERASRGLRALALLVILGGLGAGLTSCGSSSGGSSGGGGGGGGNTGTPAGTYTVTVTASTSGTGSSGQTANLTVTITD
jgi:uncharacterized repeat protein (TIGR03803 family)